MRGVWIGSVSPQDRFGPREAPIEETSIRSCLITHNGALVAPGSVTDP